MSELSFKPTAQDIGMFRADPKSFVFKVMLPAPRDITTDTIIFGVYAGAHGTPAKIGPKTNAPGQHSSPSLADGGEITFALSAADTKPASTTAVTCWQYEVKLRPAGGVAGVDDIVIFYGNLFIYPRAEQIV